MLLKDKYFVKKILKWEKCILHLSTYLHFWHSLFFYVDTSFIYCISAGNYFNFLFWSKTIFFILILLNIIFYISLSFGLHSCNEKCAVILIFIFLYTCILSMGTKRQKLVLLTYTLVCVCVCMKKYSFYV